jgi:hypothetical protein
VKKLVLNAMLAPHTAGRITSGPLAVLAYMVVQERSKSAEMPIIRGEMGFEKTHRGESATQKKLHQKPSKEPPRRWKIATM